MDAEQLKKEEKEPIQQQRGFDYGWAALNDNVGGTILVTKDLASGTVIKYVFKEASDVSAFVAQGLAAAFRVRLASPAEAEAASKEQKALTD